MGNGRTWTPEEDLYLKENLSAKSNVELADALGVTKNSIIHRLARIGLSRRKDSVTEDGEEWIKIPFAPRYSVSTLAKIRNDKTGKEIKQYLDENGYMHTHLVVSKGKSVTMDVHRIMALAFMPHPDSANLTVNHIDTNKLNNRLHNFEWITRVGNIKHAWENGLNEGRVGTNSHFATTSEETIRAICQMLQDGKTNHEITEHFQLTNKQYVSAIKCGVLWKHISSQYKIKKNVPSANKA